MIGVGSGYSKSENLADATVRLREIQKRRQLLIAEKQALLDKQNRAKDGYTKAGFGGAIDRVNCQLGILRQEGVGLHSEALPALYKMAMDDVLSEEDRRRVEIRVSDLVREFRDNCDGYWPKQSKRERATSHKMILQTRRTC